MLAKDKDFYKRLREIQKREEDGYSSENKIKIIVKVFLMSR